MQIPTSKWLLHCTKCSYASETAGTERDVICQRCGGFVEITEHITFTEIIEDNKNNDIRSN